MLGFFVYGIAPSYLSIQLVTLHQRVAKRKHPSLLKKPEHFAVPNQDADGTEGTFMGG